jgi:hypothetical protein
MTSTNGVKSGPKIEVNELGTIRLEPIPAPGSGHGTPGQLTPGRRPEWLRVRAADSPRYQELKGLFRGKSLHTVCEEAMCPNIGECWGRGYGYLSAHGRHLYP